MWALDHHASQPFNFSAYHDPEGLLVEGPGVPVVCEAGQEGLLRHGGRSESLEVLHHRLL